MQPDLFISWSGNGSKIVAEKFKEGLSTLLPSVECFVSSYDIQPGTAWLNSLTDALKQVKFGLFCLTPDAAASRWIYFEAGAIWKRLNAPANDGVATDDEPRIWAYLINWTKEDPDGPFSPFHCTRAEKERTRRMILAMKKVFGTKPADVLGEDFDKFWSSLEQACKAAFQIDTGARLETPDEKFWGPCLQNTNDPNCRGRKLSIVYNEMLCFRDYVNDILVRSTDINSEEQEKEIDRFVQRLVKISPIGFRGSRNANFFQSRQYLLKGEIDARDRIKSWFEPYAGRVEVNCKVSGSTKNEELRDAHLILLGNPRTNRFIQMVQERNPDFRIQMQKEEMKSIIRGVTNEEIQALREYGKIRKDAWGRRDFVLSDDTYDPRNHTGSFVVVSRCHNPIAGERGTCTVIGSYSNPAIYAVAAHLTGSAGVTHLLGDAIDAETQCFPDRFQCLIRVHTDHREDSNFSRNPECVWLPQYPSPTASRDELSQNWAAKAHTAR